MKNNKITLVHCAWSLSPLRPLKIYKSVALVFSEIEIEMVKKMNTTDVLKEHERVSFHCAC